MKVLTSSTEVNREVLRLLKECASFQVAVAWASANFDASELLLECRTKMERLIVGTHFFQTDPAFLERFLDDSKARFILKPDGVFHPKLYFFSHGSGHWECLIGSPNFTKGGFGGNEEIAILISDTDSDGANALSDVSHRLETYWVAARPISALDLELYRKRWKIRQPLLRRLHGTFGDPQNVEEGDGGRDPSVVNDLTLDWKDFFQQVLQEPDRQSAGRSTDERLKVIRAAKALFATHATFGDIDRDGRRRIAGLEAGDGINFLWFGSMVGAGVFQQAINNNNEHFARALDLIPNVGSVSRDAYLAYVVEFKLAFPNGRDGIGTASRLLTMKRPDYFLCLDARNKDRLTREFGIKKSIGYEDYWDSIIERIQDAPWWNAPPPAPGIEREVWESRAAFLDALYYDGKDMPAYG